MANIRIGFHLEDEHHEVLPDLIDEELFAIGRVTVGFAYLEHMLLFDSVDMLTKRHVKTLPEGIFVVSFDRRLKEWRKLIRKYRRGAPRQIYLEIAKRIKALQKARNRITHGLWDWEYGDPETINASTEKPSFEFTESFDLEKLLKISQSIAQINFQLTYPRGKAQAHRMMAMRGASMSRGFAMMMTGKPLPPSLKRGFDKHKTTPKTT